MAIGALPRRNRVRSRQREGRVVVVERRICPDSRVMTDFARSGKAGGGVRRVGGTRVVFLVARVAQRAVQRIVIVDVAIGTEPRRHRVRAGQLEAGGRVVEGSVRPQDGVVAGLASRRERCGDVIHRRGRVVVIRLVAGHTGRRRQVVIVVDVAIGAGAGRHRVRTTQREAGSVVIKGCIQPGAGAVTLIASLREV